MPNNNCDFLVIGSGIGGLSYALKVADYGKVILISKSSIDDTNTSYAQGGIASVMYDPDTFEKHIQDTLICGDGLCNEEVVRMVVSEAPAQISQLMQWGVKFDRKPNGQYDLAREGGHSEHRILHHKDNTGYEIIRKFPNKASKALKNLFHGDWGLDEIGKRMALATDEQKLYTGDAKAWFNANKKGSTVTIKDYQSRDLNLSEKVFNSHTSAKYQDRVKLLDSIKEVASNPDEVWLNDFIKGKYDNFIAIKYYKDNVIAVVCRINEGKVYEITTWFRIAVESTVKDKLQNPRTMYRRGLLIKNKK